MFRRKLKNKWQGFTLVELLVVLVIIGILAAVATPLYLSNTKRAKMSEAVAMAGVVRQAARDYYASHSTYFDVTSNQIQDPPTNGLAVDAGTAKYFSNDSYEMDAAPSDTDGASGLFQNPAIVDFVITADGSDSVQCSGGGTHCATSASEVAGYELEMDNSGRTFVRYTNSEAWSTY
jgi:prepilin-type N-terminal cleavage/methylation domain-containing protein